MGKVKGANVAKRHSISAQGRQGERKKEKHKRSNKQTKKHRIMDKFQRKKKEKRQKSRTMPTDAREISGVFVRQGIGYIQPGYFAVLRKGI